MAEARAAGGAPTADVAARLIADEGDTVVAAWRELCLWDPLLPPDAHPPIAPAVVAAVAAALSRPQPLGWGADPEIEKVAEVFAAAVESVDVAVGQLVCLREAVTRHLDHRIPVEEEAETRRRLTMVIDRAIGVAAAHATRHLARDVFIEPLTGLLNRRALERDLRRQIGRSSRADRRFGLLMLDLDQLQAVNDRDGHRAGDALLEQMAAALREALGDGTTAYRSGGDEFVVLASREPADGFDGLAARVARAGAPPFSWGWALFPDDGRDLVPLIDAADTRLIQARKQHGVHG